MGQRWQAGWTGRASCGSVGPAAAAVAGVELEREAQSDIVVPDKRNNEQWINRSEGRWAVKGKLT